MLLIGKGKNRKMREIGRIVREKEERERYGKGRISRNKRVKGRNRKKGKQRKEERCYGEIVSLNLM